MKTAEQNPTMQPPQTAPVFGHTPGPWHRGCAGANKIQILIADKNDNPCGLVAEVNGLIEFLPGEEIGERARANARLIAAAPELLVELRNLVLAASCYATWKPGGAVENSLTTARAAIARATGGQQ